MLELVLIPYLGGMVGQSQADTGAEPVPSYTLTIDDTGDVARVVGGLQIIPYLAIEASVGDIGEYTVQYRGPEYVDGTIEIYGASLSAIGIIPVGPAALQLRAGMASLTVEQRITTSIPGGNSYDEVDDTEPVYGIGATWDVGKARDIRLMLVAERYQDIGDPVITGESDIDVFAIGAAYRFR